MTFKDIFKKSFIEGYSASELDLPSIASCLLIACLIGIFIFAIYRVICRKAFFNKNFSISLIALSVITAAIILTVQSSVVISLGMVGALSIVRFRTAIKDPLDLIFLFWSISCGIIAGAGLAVIAVTLSVIIALILIIFNAIPAGKGQKLLLVSTADTDSEKALVETAKKLCRRATVRSRSVSAGQLDLIMEVTGADEAALAREMMNISGVISSSLIAHDGEVTF